MSALVWHTHEVAFEKIIADGAIKPATAGIAPGERPIVWFSTDPYWEETVFKGVMLRGGTIRDLGMREMLKVGMRLFRIAVRAETAPFNWRELRERSGMPDNAARGLAKIAKLRGARPVEWRGTFSAVTSDQWVAVEEFRSGQWVPYDRSDVETGSNRN